MSYMADLQQVFDKYDVAVPPHLIHQLQALYIDPVHADSGPTHLLGIDTPDANGFVALTGLNAGSHWASLRYALNEVGQTLPVHSRQWASVELNCENANGSFLISGFLPVCRDVVETVNGITGLPEYKIGPNNLPGTQALPFDWTIERATAHFKALPAVPSSGSGFAHP